MEEPQERESPKTTTSTSSPFSSFWIRSGILLEIDGIKLNKMCDLRTFIYTKKAKDEVTFKVLRNNRERDIKVILAKK